MFYYFQNRPVRHFFLDCFYIFNNLNLLITSMPFSIFKKICIPRFKTILSTTASNINSEN